jgi:acetyl esterase
MALERREPRTVTADPASPSWTKWEPRIDPELRAVLRLLADDGGDLTDVVWARKHFDDLLSGLPRSEFPADELVVSEHEVPCEDGARTVRVRVYRRPEAVGPRPAFMLIHGGGFILGSIEMDYELAARCAVELGAVVFSPDYRLAPEHPYPAGLDDCMATLRWIESQAGAYSVDVGRVAVGGLSAGGGLSAAVCLRARDEGGPPICFQLLGIPELDDRLDTPSMMEFADTPLWNRPRAEFSWRCYLGSWPREDVAVYAAPSRADDLAGLPPAYVSTAELDPLRDEGMLYAMALARCGVPVELHLYPGTFHGSALVMGADVSRRSSEEMFAALRRGLGL